MRLRIIRGSRPKTHTLGFKIEGLEVRDPRFAAWMSFREAEWLLENESLREMVERRFAGRTPQKGRFA